MPRSQGTSRKGKPKKHDRAAGIGRSLQKSGRKKHTPSASLGGMAMRQGVDSIGVDGPDGTPGGASGLAATGGPHVDNRASVLDVNDLDDFLIQAEMANREFVSEKEGLVVIDKTAQAATTAVASAPSLDILDEDEQYGRSRGVSSQTTPSFAFQELSVPRRPKWDETTTAAELDKMEKESFLNWRRAIAQKEEDILYGDGNSKNSGIKSLGVTPFEKNIEIWKQLWRVMERCSCIVQIVDARNPLFYLSKDLKRYATEELGRPMLLLVNKSDYLTAAQRQAWHEYLSDPGENGDGAWEHVFFSAYDEQQKLDRAAADERHEDDDDGEDDDGDDDIAATSGNKFNTLEDIFHDDSTVDDEDQFEIGNNSKDNKQSTSAPVAGSTTGTDSTSDIGVENPLTRDQLLDWLHSFASKNDCADDPKYNRIPFGMVGFPNVGKSSVINVLMGNAKHTHGVVRVGVASQPGKTKHFQTLLLPDRNDMLLCDCPGLVFPSFVSNTADLIAAGVYPIAQMRDPWPTMNLLCRRIPRQVLNAQYGIEITMPTADAMLEAREGEIPPPTAEEFLTSYCNARSMLAAGSGIPDFQRASRIIIKEYADGKLLYCHSPPEGATRTMTEREFQKETLINALRKTKKLRDKLTVPQDSVAHRGGGADVDSDSDGSEFDDGSVEDTAIDEDEMLLELMGGMSATPSSAGLNKADNSKTSGRTKKWGKKGRKGRNKDPYGCHSTPDDMLADDGVPKGLSVKSGNKKNRKSGYTRGGIRAV